MIILPVWVWLRPGWLFYLGGLDFALDDYFTWVGSTSPWMIILPGWVRLCLGWLFYLGGVDFALDDVEDGDVAVVGLAMDRRRHHHVLRLEESPHDVKNRRLTDTGNLQTEYTQWGITQTLPTYRQSTHWTEHLNQIYIYRIVNVPKEECFFTYNQCYKTF